MEVMLIFPAYVWQRRIAASSTDLRFSMNFTLRWPADSAEQHSLK